MREKHPFIVLSFQTTVAAMEWEKRCMETGIPGTFNSTSEGDFCRLWSCVADASGRVGAVERTDRHFCL